MRPDLFIQYLQSPESLGEADLRQLEEVMQSYPCFSAAKELYLKALHQSKDLSYEACLFKTSLASPNRQQLFAYIHAIKPKAFETEDMPQVSQTQAFDLIDSFLGDDALVEEVDTPDQALESLQKLYGGYQLEVKEEVSEPEVEKVPLFESPLIQDFIDHPQEEIHPLPEQESVQVSLSEDSYASAWESLPTDSLTLTLVKIYLKQKKYERALEILKTLSLNNPEKSVYFADQIRFLEKLLTHLKK